MSSVELGFDLVITFLLAVFLLFHYGNWYRHHVIVTLAVLVAWYFSFIIITVIPLDVSNTIYRNCQLRINQNQTNASNASDGGGGTTPGNLTESCQRPFSYLEPGVLTNLWRVVYWSSQFLTWLILPMMQSYTKAGEFTVSGKVKAAILDNLIYYGSYIFICLILLAYIAIKPELDLNWSRLKAIASSASNTWGLFLLVFMLGYGLVAVPRNIWNSSCRGHSLNRSYFKMSKLAAERNSAEEKLDDALESLSSSLKSLPPGSPLTEYLDTILTQIPVEFRERMNRRRVESPIAPVDHKYLVRLHRQIKSSLQTYHRTETQWMEHINRTLELEDIEKNAKSNQRVFKRTISEKKKPIWGDRMEWYWHCCLSNWLLKLLATVTAIMSLFVIWSEATFFITSPAVSLFAVFISKASSNYNYFAIELISTVTIAYLCVCAYYTIFKIRILNYYYLARRHQTDEYSLIFAGMLLSRLTPPICLNFLGLIHMDSHVINERNREQTSETQYTQIMGHLDVLSLISDGFNIYFPMGILFIGSLTYFKVGSRVLNIIGFHQFLVEDEVTGELVTEGQQLIQREKRRRQRLEDSIDRRQKYTRMQQPVVRTEVTEEPSTWLSSSSHPINREQASYGTPERNKPPPRDLFDDV